LLDCLVSGLAVFAPLRDLSRHFRRTICRVHNIAAYGKFPLLKGRPMRRREFIALLGSAAVAGPFAAGAQQPAMPTVGILSSGSFSAYADLLGAFRQGLRETGYIEGQNVAIETRWAEGRFERLPELAAELVARRVAVIVTTGGSSSLAVKAATSTTPHVFLSQDDPVKLGLVASFNQPGGNATGMSLLTSVLVAKRLEFVRQLVPAGAPISYLMNPQFLEAQLHSSDMQAAARESGLQINVLNASNERDIDNAFTALAQRGGALIVSTDAFFASRSHQIVVLAAYHKIPAIYDRREFVAAGGLISYGTHLPDAYRQIGVYAGKIIAGAKPSELPVIQPTKFDFVINAKTAKALGLVIPDRLLALADEVIE
jgi:putative tryptophan/tyrosine transport system substrate-binding protein